MINIIGNIFGTSGYAIHTRNLANALSKLTNVKLSTQLPPNWLRDVNDRELEMIKNTNECDINIIINLPHTWKLFTNNKRNWGYCVFEGDRVPESWLEEFLNPDIEYILVPSEHTKQAIQNTRNSLEVMNKVKVIHHGVDLDLFYPKTLEQKKEDFTFLCNKGLRHAEDRGGIQYLIQAYIQEFTKDDKVTLVIKVNPAYGIIDFERFIKDLGYKDDSPKIMLIAKEVPFNEIVKLYNECDVFVSPTRAEAFNMPCIEAMACGKPVITTNFGGQTDYVNEENGWIIGGELTIPNTEILYEGVKWLTPNIDELRKVLREVFQNRQILEDKGRNALETARKFTWENSAEELIKLTKCNQNDAKS